MIKKTTWKDVELRKLYIYACCVVPGHDTEFITIQPIEHVSYDANTTSSFKSKARFITELKWIKNLQTPFPLY